MVFNIILRVLDTPRSPTSSLYFTSVWIPFRFMRFVFVEYLILGLFW